MLILLLAATLVVHPGLLQQPDEVSVNPGLFVDGPESYLLPLYLKPTSLVVVGTITEVAPEVLADGSPALRVRLRPTQVLKGQAPGRHQDIEARTPGTGPFVVGKSYFVALTMDHGRLWLAPPSATALLDGDSVVGLTWNQREWVDRVIGEGIEKRLKSRGVESRRKVFLEEVRAALKDHERDKHGNTKSRK